MNVSLEPLWRKRLCNVEYSLAGVVESPPRWTKGQGLKMTPTDPLTCLFCQHINPAESTFCNKCAAQLNLQPCHRCGAVDSKIAACCYKCGTPLYLHEIPEPGAEFEPGALDTTRTSLASDPANLAAAKVASLRRDSIPGPTVNERSHEKNGSDIVTSATVSRSGWLLPVTAFLLVLLAISGYLYSRQSGNTIQTAEKKPLVQSEATAPAASAMAPHVDVEARPIVTSDPSAVGTNSIGKELTAAPPSAGVTSPVRSLSEDAEVVSGRIPPPGNECVPAVAALGLCNPEAELEKP